MTEELKLEGLVFEAVDVDVSGYVMTLTLNRPEQKNAINEAMKNELIYAMEYAAQSSSVRVVVIAANGSVFCAGGDLKGMGDRNKQGAQDTTSTVPKRGDATDISLRIRDCYKPVIIKAQGPVLAGALLMVCNATHVIAADDIYFSAPEIKRGLWPYMVMASLFRVMPRRQGLDFIMRGTKMDAATARKHGLATEIVHHSDLDSRVDELAKEMAGLAPNTMRRGLKAFYQQEDLAMTEALPILKEMLEETIRSADAREGITAFIEKREPIWPEE